MATVRFGGSTLFWRLQFYPLRLDLASFRVCPPGLAS